MTRLAVFRVMAVSSRRWKLACGILAALTAYSWLREPAPLAVGARPTASRGSHRGPLRVSASALGVTPRQLVEQLLAASDVEEMRDIATRLAAVAGDEAIDPLKALLEDDRDGVPGIVIDLWGKIGTDHAVASLIELTKDPRFTYFSSALYALGDTHNANAETFLIGYVDKHPTAYDALQALARFQSDGAVAAIANAAESADDEYQRYAFEALATIHTPAAQDALRELIDSPNLVTATRALDAIEDIDESTLAKLTAIVRSGDVELGRSALGAIARAGGEDATPFLVEIARDGSAELRRLAVQGLGNMKSQVAFETLVSIVEGDGGEIANTALDSIAGFETAESREFVISIALGETSLAAEAVAQLADMTGPDIDGALLVIAKSDTATANTALTHLLGREHPEALALATSRARSGDDEEKRFAALQLLADANTDAALGALVEIVRAEHGPLKQRAFDMLSRTHRNDAVVGELLTASLRSSEPGEAAAAARALGNAGTAEAREALVSALASSDSDLAYAAASSLGRYRLDDTAAAALANAAERDKGLADIAMRKLIEMSSPHGTRLAEAALRGDDQDAAMRTISMLREARNPASLKLVEEAVHTTEGEVRAVAIRALGDSGDPRMVEVITSALDDGSPAVRENVAYALRAIGGDKARGALINMSRSADADDRVTALQTLRDEDNVTVRQRVKEMLRDPEPRVVTYAVYAMAGSSSGAKELRMMVLDGSTPYQLRYEAALALQRYSELDERTSDWLASVTASANDYGE